MNPPTVAVDLYFEGVELQPNTLTELLMAKAPELAMDAWTQGPTQQTWLVPVGTPIHRVVEVVHQVAQYLGGTAHWAPKKRGWRIVIPGAKAAA